MDTAGVLGIGVVARRGVVLVVAAVGAIVPLSAWAGAGVDYPPNEPTTGPLDIPSAVQAGADVPVSGKSCGPNQVVTVAFNGVAVATTTTDAKGAFTTSFRVPSGTSPGEYSVVASNDGCVLSAVLSVSSGRPLAFTGTSNTVSTAWVAVGLVALGAALVFVARRRLSSVR